MERIEQPINFSVKTDSAKHRQKGTCTFDS